MFWKIYRRIILEDNPLLREKQKHHGKNTSHNGSERVGNLCKVTQQSWDLNPNLTVPASSSAFSGTLILQFPLRVIASPSFAPDTYSLSQTGLVTLSNHLTTNFCYSYRFKCIVNSIRQVGKNKIKRLCLVFPNMFPKWKLLNMY